MHEERSFVFVEVNAPILFAKRFDPLS